MPGRLDGKVAIITGAAGGFGKGIAKKFVDEGAKVIIADMVEEAGRATAKELGCEFHLTNVTKRQDWESIKELAEGKFGRIDCVVNNAGWTYVNKPTGEVTEEEFDKVFDVNVKALYHSTNVIVPYQLSKLDSNNTGNTGMSWVTIASTAGIRPRPGLCWYNASKAAVINASKSLAIEYSKQRIRFNTVSPVVGLGTGLTNSFLGKPENEKTFVATVPLGRASTPQDVANSTAYLCSDEAEFLTGIDIPVDGGRCI